jgi:1-acyl-sn-glycerol-3-phosphate acyltransferase
MRIATQPTGKDGAPVSERFYRAVRVVGRWAFRVASDPRILHAERAERPGAYLLAANHESVFDAPLLIAVNPRVIYWLSIREIFRNPFARWFLSSMNASPLDRSRVDTATVRTIVRHLRQGKVVGIFPEGGVKTGEDSALKQGSIHDGVCRLAMLARVPVLPCVVLGGGQFARWTRWAPGARTRWAVAFGEPIFPPENRAQASASKAMAEEITLALRALSEEALRHV